MKTTIGELITTLFDEYADVYSDKQLIAIATQQRVHELMHRHARDTATLARPRR